MRTGLLTFLAAVALAGSAVAQPSPAAAPPLKTDTPVTLGVLFSLGRATGPIQLEGPGFACRTDGGQTGATLSDSADARFECPLPRLPGNDIPLKWLVTFTPPGGQILAEITTVLSMDDAGRASASARIGPSSPSPEGFRVDLQAEPASNIGGDLGLYIRLSAARGCELDQTCL